MDDELHKELLALTADLRQRLATYGTEEVAARFAMYAFGQANISDHDDKLTSPARQTAFALSVLMATAAPDAPTRVDDTRWLGLIELLNEIFACYTRMYFRDGGQVTGQADTRSAQLAVMSAFLHHFNTGIVATTHQVADRIRLYLTPHDSNVARLLGIDATTCLKICDHLTDRAQASLDEIHRLGKEERRIRLGLLDRAKAGRWTQERLQKETLALLLLIRSCGQA